MTTAMHTYPMPASPHNAASGICVMLSNSNPEAAKAELSARVEKRGPWITTTVPPSWTVAPVLRIPSRATVRMPE